MEIRWEEGGKSNESNESRSGYKQRRTPKGSYLATTRAPSARRRVTMLPA